MVLPAIDTFPQTLFELFKPYRNLVLYSVITFSHRKELQKESAQLKKEMLEAKRRREEELRGKKEAAEPDSEVI